MITLSLSEKAISSEKKRWEQHHNRPIYRDTTHVQIISPWTNSAGWPKRDWQRKKTRNKKSIVPPPGKMHTDRQGHLLHINDGANAPWKK